MVLTVGQVAKPGNLENVTIKVYFKYNIALALSVPRKDARGSYDLNDHNKFSLRVCVGVWQNNNKKIHRRMRLCALCS